MTSNVERIRLRQGCLRAVPFCLLLSVLCCIARIDLGFAALTVHRDLGLSGGTHGLADRAFHRGHRPVNDPMTGGERG